MALRSPQTPKGLLLSEGLCTVRNPSTNFFATDQLVLAKGNIGVIDTRLNFTAIGINGIIGILP
jgi:hypothetical protein